MTTHLIVRSPGRISTMAVGRARKAPQRWLGGALAVCVAALGVLLQPGFAAAEDGVFDAWARWVSHQGRWRGQAVLPPDPQARPGAMSSRLDSTFESVHVHAGPDTSEHAMRDALSAAETTLQTLRREGWPLPAPDGGRGETPGLDVYLQEGVVGAHAGFDDEDALSMYDGAIVFASVDLYAASLQACVVSAVVQAALASADAAEAEAWRQAMGAWFAWRMTGELGCGAEGQMRVAPEEGITHAESGESSAVWLAMLSARVDGGSGRFLRDMWYFAQQDSGQARMLRASPDLWEATARALQNADESLDDLAVDFAIARYVDTHALKRTTRFPILAELAAWSDQSMPVRDEIRSQDLPRHVYADRGLSPLGSSYFLVHTPNAANTAQLQVWLRGELGPRWSLAAVQLDARGRELGRMVAPARRTPRSYLPIWLSAETSSVLLVVTRLPKELPDADVPTPAPAFYKLIVDAQPSRG